MSRSAAFFALITMISAAGVVCVQPTTAKSKNHENPICKLIEKNAVKPISFPLSHAVSPRQAAPGLARIDIDNDGLADNVIRIAVRYKECESSGLAVADDTRTRVPDSELNQLLLSLSAGCEADLNVLSHEGRTYIEAVDVESSYSSQKRKRRVLAIAKEEPRLREICVFDVARSKR